MEENNSVVHSGSGGVKEMVAIALPMVVSAACDTVMMFTDRLFLSRLGPEHMSASMGGGMSAFMMISFFVGLIGYSTAVTAQYMGGGDKGRCPRVTYQSLLIALIAYPLILLLMPVVIGVFGKSGLSAEQLAHQVPYFKILTYGAIFGLLRTVFSAFFSGIGLTRIVMTASVTAMVCNIAFSYVLIFGKFGVPAMGIVGAAYGTIGGSVISILMLGYTYLRYLRAEGVSLSTVTRFDREAFFKILKFGFPAGLELSLNMVAFTMLITIFQAISLESASAITIMFNWDHVAYIPLIGLEIGVTSLFGRYVGANREDIAHKTLKSGLLTGTIYSGILMIFFLFTPGLLADVFAPAGYDPAFEAIRDKAVFMIRTAVLYISINAVVIVYAGALRGAGDTYAAMIITVGVMWVMTGLSYVMLHVWGMSLEMSWLTLIAVIFLMPALLIVRYRSGKWKKYLPAQA